MENNVNELLKKLSDLKYINNTGFMKKIGYSLSYYKTITLSRQKASRAFSEKFLTGLEEMIAELQEIAEKIKETHEKV